MPRCFLVRGGPLLNAAASQRPHTRGRLNPLAVDPSRTGRLRRDFAREMKARWRSLLREVNRFLLEDDALGLQPLDLKITLHEKRKYQFLSDPAKVDEFKKWLDQQIQAKILGADRGTDAWTSKYIDSAYKQAMGRASQEALRMADTPKPEGFAGTRAQFERSSFGAPETMRKVQLLGTRTFEDLKGITSQMSSQMARVLAGGLADGKGAIAIAREMARTVEGVPLNRAIMITRTEIIRAHAEGQLDQLQELGVEDVGAQVEFATAGDGLVSEGGRVCPECADLEGKIFTIEEARGIIPVHPNCRCSWRPYFESVAGILGKRTPAAPKTPTAAGGKVEADKLAGTNKPGTQAQAINDAIPDVGGFTTREIAAKTGLPDARVSGHLKWLQAKGQIVKGADGRYTLAEGTVLPPKPAPKPTPPPAPPPPQPTPPKPTPPAPPAPTPPQGGSPAISPPTGTPAPAQVTGKPVDAEGYRQRMLALEEELALKTAKLREVQKAADAEALRLSNHRGKLYEQMLKLDERNPEYANIAVRFREAGDAREKAWKAVDEAGASLRQVRSEYTERARAVLVETKNLSHLMANRKLLDGNEVVAKEILSWVPEGTLSNWAQSRLSQVAVGRSSYSTSFFDNASNFIGMRKGAGPDVFAHEFGHAMSYAERRIQNASNEFFSRRTQGEPIGRLKGYDKTIVGKEDKFGSYSVYGGRKYPFSPDALEIPSVGLEHLFRNPMQAAQADPEWFRLTIGWLKNIPTGTPPTP